MYECFVYRIKQRNQGNKFKSSLNFALNKDFQFVKE